MGRRIERAPGGAWELDENAAVALPHGPAASVVRVHRGTVLVTQAGDLEDHLLEGGQELVLRPRGRAVAWAFTAASVSLSAARAAAARDGSAARGRRPAHAT